MSFSVTGTLCTERTTRRVWKPRFLTSSFDSVMRRPIKKEWGYKIDKLDELLIIASEEKDGHLEELDRLRATVREIDVEKFKKGIFRDVKNFKKELFITLSNMDLKNISRSLGQNKAPKTDELMQELREKEVELANSRIKIDKLETELSRLKSAASDRTSGLDTQIIDTNYGARKRTQENYSINTSQDEDINSSYRQNDEGRVDTPITILEMNPKDKNGCHRRFNYEPNQTTRFDKETKREQYADFSSYTYSRSDAKDAETVFQVTSKRLEEPNLKPHIANVVDFYLSIFIYTRREIEAMISPKNVDIDYYRSKVRDIFDSAINKLKNEEILGQIKQQTINSDVREDFSVAINRKSNIDSMTNDLQLRVDTLNDIVNSKDRQLESQSTTLLSYEKTIEKLKEDNSELKELIFSQKEEIEAAKRNASKAEELIALLTKLQDTMHKKKMKYKEHLDILNAERSKLQNDLKATEQQLKRQEELNSLRAEVQNRAIEMSPPLRKELLKMKDKIVLSLNQNKGELFETLQNAKRMKSEFVIWLKSLASQQKSVNKTRISKFIQDSNSKERACIELKTELERQVKISKELGVKLESQNLETTKLATLNKDLLSQLVHSESRESNINTLKESVDSLKSELRFTQAKFNDQGQENSRLLSDINQLKITHTEILKKTKDAYETKLKAFISDASHKYEEANAKRLLEITALKKKVINLSKLVEVYENDYNQYKKITNEQLHNFKNERLDLNNKIKVVTKEKDEVRAKCLELADDYEGQINKLVENMKKEKEYIVYLKGKLQAYEKRSNTSK